jgi:polar amino acid transport system substrate-binding protein
MNILYFNGLPKLYNWKTCSITGGIKIVKYLLLLGISLLVLAGCTGPGTSSSLRIITEQNPPFNYTDEAGQVTGQATEIVKKLISATGTTANIEILPWAEGYELMQKNSNVMLYSTVRTESRENMFKWVGPVGSDDEWFFTRAGSEIKISSLDDARKVKSIAVYKNDRNQLFLSEKGFTNLTIYNDDMECVKNLTAGNVDLWLGPSKGSFYITWRARINAADLQKVFFVRSSEYYLAFNKNTPDSVIKAWQTALDDMKKPSGSDGKSIYEEITNSYTAPHYSPSKVTREQVIQLVETTVKDLAVDVDGTISKINSLLAPYRDSANPELYVYIFDINGLQLANASNPAGLVGRNFMNVPDMAGKPYGKIVEGALKNGQGWEDYLFTMPGKSGLFYKATFYKLANGSDGKQYIVCCGLYRSAPGQ